MARATYCNRPVTRDENGIKAEMAYTVVSLFPLELKPKWHFHFQGDDF
jgi:hypothetical protein